ncbi:nucleoside recognition domain-containing protein [Anoxynatronum buryatiense]|uniref:Nucleoside recognition n=1 Tax=Anoxynatronum buryatiense TaxID=489973 RepID=A0AA45WTH4_9CLOT|nr:nucleoside recognition domain-containing protein [Anoxynatronum buryatiense]SMP43068.1 Nucleoside recognition [Anoxynatronum buryatiense]
MMDLSAVFQEAFFGSLTSVWNIAKVVMPLMIVIQVAKDYRLLDYLSRFMKPATNFLGMSRESGFPLMVGLAFGLSFGAGVIVQSAKEGNLSKKDLILLSAFLASCHAVVEDTLIFVAVGANGWILLSARLLTAIVATFLLSKRLKHLTHDDATQLQRENLKQPVS